MRAAFLLRGPRYVPANDAYRGPGLNFSLLNGARISLEASEKNGVVLFFFFFL